MRKPNPHPQILITLITCATLIGCGESPSPTSSMTGPDSVSALMSNLSSVTPSPIPPVPAPQILSAFFGLDNALPVGANPLCNSAGGLDGLPIVLSQRVEIGSTSTGHLDPEAFRIWVGETEGEILCATLAPALEPQERRTILLIGDLGSAETPPTRVEILGDIPLETGASAQGLSTTDIVPLEAGPTLVLAETLILDPRPVPAERPGPRCPLTTRQQIKLTWNAGVSLIDSRPSLSRIQVKVAGQDQWVTPTAIRDLNDFDNHTDLCLSQSARAEQVRIAPGLFADPNQDPNPVTTIQVQ